GAGRQSDPTLLSPRQARSQARGWVWRTRRKRRWWPSCSAVRSHSRLRLRLLLGALLRPGHHRAQAGADLLDLVLGGSAAKRLELRPAGRLFGDQVAGETPLLDLPELRAHAVANAVVDDPRADCQVAVL